MYLLHRSVGPSVQFLYSGCMIAAKFRIMTIEQRAVRGTAENFVICDTQKSYSENLFRRLSEKLSGYFQFHVFHDIENLKIAAKSMQVNILLIGEEYGKEDRDEIPARQKYLLIGEKIPNERSPTEIPFFRYQSVSSMLELLLQEKDQENSEVGGVMIVFQFTAEKQKQKEQRKKEIRQMQFDYPQLINKFSLYIGAGMTVRRAWIQIVKEYDKEKHYLGERTVYEEMRYTMNELKNGRPESECYEAFGRRCESPVYRKFGMLLSQNLRKGTKGLTNLLQREAQEAFEERKNMAKKLGEEAGTKLMIPLFLMLAVVIVIVTVPAFLTIQI